MQDEQFYENTLLMQTFRTDQIIQNKLDVPLNNFF